MDQGTIDFKLYIPSEISSDSNLNLSEMRVLATIKALDNAKNCYANNPYLAKCVKLSERQVSRVIKSLEVKGYIEIENGKSFRRTIKVLEEVKAAVKEVVAVVEEVKETVKEVAGSVAKKVDEVAKKFKPGRPKSSYKPKSNKFNSGYSHGFDFNVLEQLETLKLMLTLGQLSPKEYDKLAEPLLSQIEA